MTEYYTINQLRCWMTYFKKLILERFIKQSTEKLEKHGHLRRIFYNDNKITLSKEMKCHCKERRI